MKKKIIVSLLILLLFKIAQSQTYSHNTTTFILAFMKDLEDSYRDSMEKFTLHLNDLERVHGLNLKFYMAEPYKGNGTFLFIMVILQPRITLTI